MTMRAGVHHLPPDARDAVRVRSVDAALLLGRSAGARVLASRSAGPAEGPA